MLNKDKENFYMKPPYSQKTQRGNGGMFPDQ